ncbi:MAG: MBL fold metallo-hydrolase [Pseudomonadota bacterium]
MALDRSAGDGAAQMHFPWDDAPDHVDVRQVVDGILWVRSPLPMRLDHVNCYLLDEGDSWTLVDTGMNTSLVRGLWEGLLAGPLSSKPIGRVVLTHHHPDHIGLAGWFCDKGADLWCTRLAYVMARMMLMDRQDKPSDSQVAFRRESGAPEEEVQRYAADKPWMLSDAVGPLPARFRQIREGETLRLGGRDWQVHFGHGHAPDHVTLWNDEVILAGDQIIPGISTNIGVWSMEPDANPLGDWLESCRRLKTVSNGSNALVLPGHKLPFHGADFRLEALIENHESALRRILRALEDGPRSAAGVFVPIFKREITGSQYGLALAESVAHMNYLHQTGHVSRSLEEGVWMYALSGT